MGLHRAPGQRLREGAATAVGPRRGHGRAAAEPAVGGARRRARRPLARQQDAPRHLAQVQRIRARRGHCYTRVYISV